MAGPSPNLVGIHVLPLCEY